MPKIVRPKNPKAWEAVLGPQKPEAPPGPKQSDLSTILQQMENPPAANQGVNTQPPAQPQYSPAPQSGMLQYPPQLVIDVTNYVYGVLKGKNLPTTPAINGMAAAYSGEENPAAFAHAKSLVDILGLEAFDIRNEQVEASSGQGSQGQGNALQQIVQTIKNKPKGIFSVGQGIQIVSSGGNQVIDVNGHEIVIHNGMVIVDGNLVQGGNLASTLQGVTGASLSYTCQSEFLTNQVPSAKLKDYITALFGQVNTNSWLASTSPNDLLELSSLQQLTGIKGLEYITEISSGPVKVEKPFYSSYFIVMEMQPPNTRLLAARALDACYKDGTISAPSVTFYFPTQPYDLVKASSMDNRLAALKQGSEIPSQTWQDEAQKLGIGSASNHLNSYLKAWDHLIKRFTV